MQSSLVSIKCLVWVGLSSVSLSCASKRPSFEGERSRAYASTAGTADVDAGLGATVDGGSSRFGSEPATAALPSTSGASSTAPTRVNSTVDGQTSSADGVSGGSMRDGDPTQSRTSPEPIAIDDAGMNADDDSTGETTNDTRKDPPTSGVTSHAPPDETTTDVSTEPARSDPPTTGPATTPTTTVTPTTSASSAPSQTSTTGTPPSALPSPSTTSPTATTSAGTAAPTSAQPVCGDHTIEGNEECDVGDAGAGDGCSSACQIEEGYACDAQSCTPVCGDGLLVGDERQPEHCDDGNSNAADGCHSCDVQPGWTCTAAPSRCTDIDECNDPAYECPERTTCQNEVGWYHCDCTPPYVSVDEGCDCPQPTPSNLLGENSVFDDYSHIQPDGDGMTVWTTSGSTPAVRDKFDVTRCEGSGSMMFGSNRDQQTFSSAGLCVPIAANTKYKFGFSYARQRGASVECQVIKYGGADCSGFLNIGVLVSSSVDTADDLALADATEEWKKATGTLEPDADAVSVWLDCHSNLLDPWGPIESASSYADAFYLEVVPSGQ